MRIALVYDGVYPYSVGGGEKIFHDLANYLGQRHEVHLIGVKLWDGDARLETAPGVTLHGVAEPLVRNTLQHGDARSPKQALAFAWRVFAALKRLGPFDVVDCMATPYFPLYASALRGLMRRFPVVSTWLELWTLEDWRAYVGRGPKARIGYLIEQWATCLPRHIVSISPQTSGRLRDSGVGDDRLTTVPPWINLAHVRNVARDSARSDVIFVGRLIKSKGVATLVEALPAIVDACPGLKCRIIGDGPERGALEARIEALGVGEHVSMEGFLESHEDVLAAMKASRILVLPSRREGFGMVIVEGVACGLLPVTIAAPNNAARILVEESGCGAVCEDRAPSLAAAVTGLLALDNAGREAQCARGREWAEQYDFERGAAAYEAVYRNAAGIGPR